MMASPEAWLVLCPLAAAALAFLWRSRGAFIGIVSALINGALVAWLIALMRTEGVRRIEIGGWSAPLGIEFYADGLSPWMLMLAAILGVATAVYARGYFKDPGSWFWPIWLMLAAAINALFLTRDIFNAYVCLELLGLSSVALIALSGNPDALAAALRYFFVSMLGSLFYLLGVSLLYSAHATVDIDRLRSLVSETPATLAAAAFMTVGLLLKTALFPLHFWLPPAHANAPAPVSALLSGLVVKASLYLLLRLWFEVFPGAIFASVAPLFGLLGAAAVVWGGIQALLQERVKLVVAYSTVVQVGYFFLLFPLAAHPLTAELARQGVIYLLLAHAIAKSAAFMAAGNFIRVVGSDRLEDMKGAGTALPVSMFSLGLAGISLMGLPPSAGFIGKWKLFSASLTAGQWWWTVVLAAGGLLSAAYFFRILSPALAEPSRLGAKIPRTMKWTPMALALAGVLLGFLAPQLLEIFEIGAPLRPAAAMEGGP